MKAFSRSQGKVVDIPDAGGSPMATPDMGNGDSDQIKAAFLLQMMKQPKQAANLMQVYKFAHPDPTEADIKRNEQKTQLNTDLNSSLEDIQNARSNLQTTGSGGQYSLYGIRKMLPQWLGGITPEVARTQASLSQVNQRLFDIAGKAFTGPERQILEGQILDLMKNPASNQAALDQAESLINRKLGKKSRPPLSSFDQ
jgi:hypothetical protein